MGKKASHSSSSSMKVSKHEKKQHLNNFIKIQRPKVIITDPSNFKNLVQQYTGNGKYSPVVVVESSPPPSWEEVVPFSDYHHHHHYYHHHHHESNGLSSSFTAPLEGSPDLSVGNSLDEQKMDFFKDLEAMLMEMDYSSNCDGMFEQQDQACVYDYDLSTFI